LERQFVVNIFHQDPNYGDPEKSGKMVVVKALLSLWKKEGHRVLLFSQTRQMLDILEKMIKSLDYQYFRMDGTTAIQNRMTMVDQYNANKDIFVFLLTTKVGGLGLNLTGADRVIIFDPDWVS
jgi:DNA excision repair protein ERCC-6